jgi:hypothetical protein
MNIFLQSVQLLLGLGAEVNCLISERPGNAFNKIQRNREMRSLSEL